MARTLIEKCLQSRQESKPKYMQNAALYILMSKRCFTCWLEGDTISRSFVTKIAMTDLETIYNGINEAQLCQAQFKFGRACKLPRFTLGSESKLACLK